VGVRLSVFDGVPHRVGRDGRGAPEPHPRPYPYAFGADAGDPSRVDLDEPIAFVRELQSLGVAWINATAASPYYVREEGNGLSFVSETRCPYKDATIVWRGTVEDGQLRGESTWVVKRWYWTVEKKFRFEGTLASGSS